MNNDIYANMLSAYDLSTEQQKRNALTYGSKRGFRFY